MKRRNIKQNESFQSVIDYFKKNSWKVRQYPDLYNTLIVEREAISLVIYHFFGKKGSKVWKPIEGVEAGLSLRWANRTGSCPSPIHYFRGCIENNNLSGRRPILLLMDGVRLDIEPEKLDEWAPISVISSERLLSINDADRLALLYSDFHDVSLPWKSYRDKLPDPSENEPRALPIHYMATIEDHASLATKLAFLEGGPPSFNYETRFAMELYGFDQRNRPLEPSLNTYFRPSKAGGCLLTYIDRNSLQSMDHFTGKEREFKFILSDHENKPISLIRAKSSDFDSPVKLHFSKLEAGRLKLDVIDMASEKVARSFFFEVEEGPECYDECLKMNYFGLFRLDEGRDCDIESLVARGTQSCYKQANLAGIKLIADYDSISDNLIEGQFLIRVTDNSDKLVYEHAERTEMYTGSKEVIDYNIPSFKLTTGRYFVTISFFGEVIAKAQFSVGDEDVFDNFKPKHVETKHNRASYKADDTKAPMDRLKAMIGLERLKKDLQGIIAQVKLDKAREKLGLPFTPRPLHLAFLGNPGTGKSTIAKILGLIYKEIGVLSQGQVITEERATLLGQNWNSEADHTRAAISASKGGILFIDEAYDLVTDHPQDPGKQVITALLTKMADETWSDWMVIFAGYTAPMEKFLSTNPGLRSRLNCVYFDDFNEEELIQIADLWLEEKQFLIKEDARTLLKMNIASAYANRSEEFGNARYITSFLTNEVLKNMALRLDANNAYDEPDALSLIEKEDIPNYHEEKDAHEAMAELNSMIGLSTLKSELARHLHYVAVLNARRKQGMYTKLPPLHMIFTGNPGTGKTSVASYLGKIYKSMGILSKGNVVMVNRADVISSHVGGTEKNMKNKIREARGNILFIDEAYTLAKKDNSNDDGHRILDQLLTVIGQESCDMIVIMAGYEKEMAELMNSNLGLKGRFSKTFNFPDYDEKELYKIAMTEVKRLELTLTEDAQEALRALIKREYQQRDDKFSNGRFAVRLVTTDLMLSMAERLGDDMNTEKLNIITREDIPVSDNEVKMINENIFDEQLLEKALKKLDSLVGLHGVKKSLHQFVDFVRTLHERDDRTMETYPLKWSFVGNFGTGKCTVARILASILKGLRLIKTDNLVKVEAEEIIGSTRYNSTFMSQKVAESKNGMLFVNGVSSLPPGVGHAISPLELRAISSIFEHERGSRAAMILAENDSPRAGLSKSLAKIGIYGFDYTLIFDDYSEDELLQLLHLHLDKLGIKLNKKSTSLMKEYITRLSTGDQAHQANSHTIRLLSFALHRLSLASKSNTIKADLVGELIRTASDSSSRFGF